MWICYMIVVISDIGLSLAIIVAGYVQYDLFEYTYNRKTQVLFELFFQLLSHPSLSCCLIVSRIWYGRIEELDTNEDNSFLLAH
jgi:hypothetical protein